MIRFVYHPALIEQAVFVATCRDAARECELHERLDPLYAIEDLETRDAAFTAAYAGWFQHGGLGQNFEQQIRTLLDSNRIPQCVLSAAPSVRRQRVDLLRSRSGHASQDGYSLAMWVQPETLIDPQS